MTDRHSIIASALYRIYPHLKEIADKVREAKPSTREWHNVYKPKIVNSVGRCANKNYPNDRFLLSSEAYEAVYFDLDRWVVDEEPAAKMEAIDYDTLAEKIAENLRKLPADALWDSDDCATFFKVSRAYFNDRISKLPTFPRTIKGCRRWLKSEIVMWAKKR